MTAISALTSTQVNTLRSGGYAGEVRIAVDPSPVVFQCQVDEDMTGSVFLSFAWATTLQGDYQDVEPDMTVIITATSDADERRNPIWRGRAPRVPTASLFYVNESSFNLLTGYVVTVLNTYEPLQKDRVGARVDGYLTYANLPPAVKGLQSFYYGEDDTDYSFSFAPTGQAMASGATIASYAWTIPGATYTAGSAATQNVTVTVPAGHIWCFLDVTDSNGVSNRFKFEILVCDRDNTAFMFEAHGDVQMNGDIDTGWNASVSYFAGVESLLNRTRVAIVAFDRYDRGAGTFPTVMFVGYLAQEETTISGDAVSSTLAETRFEIQSCAAIIAQLPVPPLAIRSTASPDAWDELTQPTTQRVIWHLITRYSTFGTLCAIDFVTTDSTWFGGEMDLEATTLLESINHIAEEINAALVFFPGGDAVLEVNANFLNATDRNALPDFITSGSITPADLFSYTLPVPYYDTVGQVEAGFASFQTSGADAVKLSGIAPAVARQEGIETPVVLAQLLNANLSQVNAITAAKTRIGDLLEWLNPPVLINLTLTDGWRFVTPSTRVWWKFDLPATDSTRGLAVPSTDRYLLTGISLTWHSDGTWDISGTARLETQGGIAQVNVSIAPSAINTDLPVLPSLSDYGAFVPDGTLNYLSTDPGDDLQPYGAGDMAQWQPLTTEGAGAEADAMPDPNCQVINPSLNFSSGASRSTSAVTVNNDPYTITVKGSTRISAGTWLYHINFTQQAGGFTPDNNYGGTSLWVNGTGWTKGTVGGVAAVDIHFIFGASVSDLTAVRFLYDNDTASANVNVSLLLASVNVYNDVQAASIGTGEVYIATPPFVEFDEVVLQVAMPATGGNPVITGVTFEGDTTNPFTGDPAANVTGDAFYQIPDDGSSPAALYATGQGLLIQSLPPGVIPEYNPNHEYVIAAEGDGNLFVFLFYLPSYTGVLSNQLYIRVCGANMGT